MLNSLPSSTGIYRHLEFFAGVGGVRLGLKDNWQTIWANDIDELKRDVYVANDPGYVDFIVRDIAKLRLCEIPNGEMASATFPCTNTSCAGDQLGLLGIKSGVVYKYLSNLEQKGGAKSVPVSLLENPTGLIARNKGEDLASLVSRLNEMGYSVSLTVVDAKHFTPQSRPRIFITGFERSLAHERVKRLESLDDLPKDMELYPNPLRKWFESHLDLDLVIPDTPALPTRTIQLVDVLDLENPNCDSWASPEYEEQLISLMSEKHKETFLKMVNSPSVVVGTIARRGRKRADGTSYNATEISLKPEAPCQRPYGGGSSRTWVLVAGQGKYRFKLITPRESARLMGFEDDFILPKNQKQAYQVTGDAVVPQAVAWVDKHVIQPVIKGGLRKCVFGEQLDLLSA